MEKKKKPYNIKDSKYYSDYTKNEKKVLKQELKSLSKIEPIEFVVTTEKLKEMNRMDNSINGLWEVLDLVRINMFTKINKLLSEKKIKEITFTAEFE